MSIVTATLKTLLGVVSLPFIFIGALVYGVGFLGILVILFLHDVGSRVLVGWVRK